MHPSIQALHPATTGLPAQEDFGYVAATALGVSVYDNRWELAAYDVGSDLKLGARFPINYIEGQDFKASLDDVKFEVPNIDPAAMIDQVIGAAV